MFAELGTAIGGLLGLGTSEGGLGEYEQAAEIWQRIQEPTFDWSEITPAELQIVARWMPETYENVVPPEVKVGADSPELRQAQMQGVAGLQRIAQEGLPEAERIAAERGARTIRGAQRQAVESALRNLQARGRAGGGEELLARIGAGQGISDLARAQSEDLQRQAVQNRLAAIYALPEAAGGVRAQDYGISADQANTYNNFYRWLSEYMTEPRRYAAQVGNQAALYNTQEAQRVADWNRQNQQAMAMYNQQRQDALRKYQGDWRLRKAAGETGAQTGLGQARYGEQAGYINLLAGLGGGIGGLFDYGQQQTEDAAKKQALATTMPIFF